MISKSGIQNKEKQKLLHGQMKLFLIEKFEVIRQKWNDGNNIASKLLLSKTRLKEKFGSICKGIIGTRAVVLDIVSGIKDALKLGFKDYLAEVTKSSLETKRWITSPEVMQAHIDLDLLKMSKTEKFEDLIQVICDPSAHHRRVVSKLILEYQNLPSEWDTLIKTIRKVVSTAAIAASSESRSNRCQKFKSKVLKKLTTSIRKQLPNQIWSDIATEESNLNEDNWKEVAKLTEQELKSVEVPNVDDDEFVSSVLEILIRDGNSSAKPRCSVCCPICLMTCDLPHDHLTGSGEAKHNCTHQPAGLVGLPSFTDEKLMPDSCTRSMLLIYDPLGAWRIPNIQKHSKVRQYVFSKYHGKLAEHYAYRRTTFGSSLIGKFIKGSMRILSFPFHAWSSLDQLMISDILKKNCVR